MRSAIRYSSAPRSAGVMRAHSPASADRAASTRAVDVDASAARDVTEGFAGGGVERGERPAGCGVLPPPADEESTRRTGEERLDSRAAGEGWDLDRHASVPRIGPSHLLVRRCSGRRRSHMEESADLVLRRQPCRAALEQPWDEHAHAVDELFEVGIDKSAVAHDDLAVDHG